EIKHQTSMLQENAITKQQNVWRDDGVHMQRMAVRMKDYEHDAKHQALLHRHTSIADLSGTQRDGLLITALCMSVINKAINLIKQEVYNVLSTPPTQHIKRIHHQSNSTQNHGNRSFLREPTVYYNNFNRSNITPQQIPYPKASHQQMSGSSRFDESSYNKLPDQQLPGILLMRSIVSYQALTVVTLNENTGVAIMRATTITVETSMRGGTSAVCCDTSKSNEIAR
ncbi:MAG: hypothetical protein OEY79_04750, partial [Anaplasmataceae bacterium]|nr:hypothetical protein [Anaplasmataceae bacterium]